MTNLCPEESKWYQRNMQKAKYLYVGKKQQSEIALYAQHGSWYDADGSVMTTVPVGKMTQYWGYEVVYVDEEDYLKLGD